MLYFPRLSGIWIGLDWILHRVTDGWVVVGWLVGWFLILLPLPHLHLPLFTFMVVEDPWTNPTSPPRRQAAPEWVVDWPWTAGGCASSPDRQVKPWKTPTARLEPTILMYYIHIIIHDVINTIILFIIHIYYYTYYTYLHDYVLHTLTKAVHIVLRLIIQRSWSSAVIIWDRFLVEGGRLTKDGAKVVS